MYHTKLFQISLTLKGDTKSVWKLIRELRVIYYKRILKFMWYLITAISYIVRSVSNFTNIIVFHYDVSVTRCYKMFRITHSYNTLIKKKKKDTYVQILSQVAIYLWLFRDLPSNRVHGNEIAVGFRWGIATRIRWSDFHRGHRIGTVI